MRPPPRTFLTRFPECAPLDARSEAKRNEVRPAGHGPNQRGISEPSRSGGSDQSPPVPRPPGGRAPRWIGYDRSPMRRPRRSCDCFLSDGAKGSAKVAAARSVERGQTRPIGDDRAPTSIGPARNRLREPWRTADERRPRLFPSWLAPSVAWRRQRAGELLLQHRLDKSARASADRVLDRVEPIIEKQNLGGDSRLLLGILRNRAVSIPARRRWNQLGWATRRLRQRNSNHLRDGTRPIALGEKPIDIA